MNDKAIVELFWQRDERALRECQKKYKHYLGKIAVNILSDFEDSREVTNECLWRAWRSIPPQKPDNLAAYLAKIARETAIDRLRKKHRQKREPSNYTLALHELEDCLPGGKSVEEDLDEAMLSESLERFLRGLAPDARICFLSKYFFCDSIRDIADAQQMSESKVKSILYRSRLALRRHLEEEGF